MLPASYVNCSIVDTFKKHLSSELESEAVKLKVCQFIVGVIRRKSYASIVCGVGEFGELDENTLVLILVLSAMVLVLALHCLVLVLVFTFVILLTSLLGVFFYEYMDATCLTVN